MRKVAMIAAVGLGLGGCQSIVEPIRTAEPSAIRSGPAPIGELPQIPRAELAAVVERNASLGKVSPPFLSAGVTQFARKSGRTEKTAYCVWADMKFGVPYTRWWIVDVFITDRGIPILLLDLVANYKLDECPAKETMEPFPELIAAREARRTGGTPAAAPPPQAQPVTSHTPVTISAPTDGRAGQ